MNVTDRQTDGQTDRHRPTASTAPTHNVARKNRVKKYKYDKVILVDHYHFCLLIMPPPLR